MSSDDQYFLDILSSIPNDVKRYSKEIAEYSRDIADSIDRHFETVAASLRETIQTTRWIPDSIKPPHHPPFRAPPPVPPGYLERAQDWVSRNRAVTAAIFAFIGTGTFIIWRRQRSHKKKRRARRAATGARTEVVVLAGSPHSPLTRSLSLDLERRGFIVYIPVSTLSEEQLVQSDFRADVRPLHLDITSPSSTQETIQKLTHHLETPHSHSSAHQPHILHLTALILLPPPPSTYPISPLITLPPSAWSDTLNNHLLAPFTLLHAFLPLLVSQSQKQHKSPSSTTTILILTPSIIPSLAPACHAPESVISGALDNYIHTLRAEVHGTGIGVLQLKLGDFDYSTVPGCVTRQQLAPYNAAKADAVNWVKEQRRKQQEAKGSSLRELHNGVFDAITGRIGRGGGGGVVFLGKGSWAYDFVGRWVPKGVVGWMMGGGARALDGGAEVVAGLEETEGGDGSVEWEKVEQAG